MAKNKEQQQKNKKQEAPKPPSEEEQFSQFINQIITNAVLQHEGIKQTTVEVIKDLGQRLAQGMMIRRALEKRIADLEGKNKKK